MKKKCDHSTLNWNECGYGGGPTADVECKDCKHIIQVPLETYKKRQPYLYRLWLEHNGGNENARIDE
jgi:hypothetical protein